MASRLPRMVVSTPPARRVCGRSDRRPPRFWPRLPGFSRASIVRHQGGAAVPPAKKARREFMRLLSWIIGATLATALAAPILAAEPVKIGILYPLTGNAASAGQASKAAIELAADIVNNAHPELKPLPLAESAGLPNLGGAKIELVSVDHQGDPTVGQSQTLRLITQDKVAALVGAYHSSVALVTTAVAERYGVPYVVAESVALNITGRGFKWVFRTTPIASDFAKAYTDFLGEMKKAGKKVQSIAIVNENTEYGTSVAGSINETARKAGFEVLQIAYSAKSTDVSAQVLQLKEKQPDAVIFVGYTADDDRRRCRFFRPLFRPRGGRHHPRGAEPQCLGYRQARHRHLQDKRDVQGQDRARPRRHQRPRDAGHARARRGDQPRGLDRSRKDPAGAQGDEPQARAAHDGLSRRQIRRHRTEHLGGDLSHSASGQGLQGRMAGGVRHGHAAMADEGVEIAP